MTADRLCGRVRLPKGRLLCCQLLHYSSPSAICQGFSAPGGQKCGLNPTSRGHTPPRRRSHMKVLEYGCVFAAGGLGYGGLELLWRGRTHWSMLLCGGVCAVLIYLIAGRERTVLWRRWTLCAASAGTSGTTQTGRSTSSGTSARCIPCSGLGSPSPACGWGGPCGKSSPPGRLSKWCPAVPAFPAGQAPPAVRMLPVAAARLPPRRPAAPAPWRSSRCGWCRAGLRRGG